MTTPPPIKISDEMIEAGGAAFDRLQDGNRGAGYDRGIVRAIAEAVAPLIAAQVLRAAYWKLRGALMDGGPPHGSPMPGELGPELFVIVPCDRTDRHGQHYHGTPVAHQCPGVGRREVDT